MAGSKFNRLNAKTPQPTDEPAAETQVFAENQNQQTNKPTNQLVNKPTNKLVVDKEFNPMFATLPNGTGVHLGVEDLRPILLQVGKEQRSFSIHYLEKNALDRATFLLKMQGLKCDANKVARAAIIRALADLEEKGKDSFLWRMLDNLSN